MAAESLRRLSGGGREPYSPDELSKHIDPVLLKDLGKIQIDVQVRKQLTVVFLDVTNFSKLCKDLNDYQDDILYFLKIYFDKAIEIIARYDGILDKFIGDGILAYFGYHSKVGNGDSHTAITAALEFKDEFFKLKKHYIGFCNKFNGKDPSDINLKCGMDNGQATLYYFNSETRNSMGSPVNRASRLEGIAENDEIMISQSIKNMVRDTFNCSEIEIKERVSSGLKTFEEERVCLYRQE